MSEQPSKFEVVDRRRMKAEEEKESHAEPPASPAAKEPAPAQKSGAEPPAERAAGPRLVGSEGKQAKAAPEPAGSAVPEFPQAPTPEESSQQKTAYTASAQRLEDLIRAQNPAMSTPPQMSFDHLVQQLYLTALFQMGAGGAPEGQRPQIDILGARNTIDLLGILAEKTKGNLSEAEDRNLQTALFDARMGFLELSSMISVRGVGAPPPPGRK